MKMPTVRKLPSGNWTCQIMVDGKRISITGPTKKQVQMEVMEYKTGKKREEIKAEAKKKTLHTATEEFIDRHRGTYSESTIAGYMVVLKHRFPELMAMPVSEITEKDCQKAISKEAKTASPKTIRNGWGLVSQVLEEETHVRFAPALPAKERYDRPYLDDSEIRKFVGYLEESGDIGAVPAMLALHSMRRSEIAGLRWENIDLEHGIIRVRGVVICDETGGRVERKANKTDGSARDIPIMIPLLRRLLEAQKQEEGLVVGVAPNIVYRRVKAACENAGFPGVTTHGLRVSFATLAHSIGMPKKDAMALGGWTDDGTMEKIYTKATERDIEKWGDRMAQFYSR